MRLGELLLDEGAVDRERLEVALREQRRAGGLLGEHLLRREAITEQALHYYLGLQRSRRVEELRRFGRLRLIGGLAGEFFRLSPRASAASVVLLFAGTALSMTFPYFVKLAFDHGGAGASGVLRLAAAAAGLQLLAQLSLYLGNRLFGEANVRFSTRLRGRLYRVLHDVHFTTFSGKTAGEWLSRLTGDVDNVVERWERLFLVFFKNLFAVSISAAVLALVDPALALLALALSAATVVVPGRVSNMANPALMRRPHLIAGAVDLLRDKLRGARVIKSLGAEREALAEFGRRFDEHYRNDFRMVRYWNIAFNLRMVVGALTVGLILFVGGRRVVAGRYGASDLVLVLVTVNMLAPYVDELMQIIISANDVKRYWSRCAELLSFNVDRGRWAKGPAGAGPRAGGGGGGARLERLSFSYGGRRVFDGLTLELGARRLYAVVGRSGSGKSTLLKLLMKELTPDEGRVVVDGLPLAELSEFEACRLVSYVGQRPVIFQDTVENNIRFGAMMFEAEVPRSAVEAAARLAGIHDRVAALEGGYGATVGEGGQALSGGERARLAVARALVKSPALCLFDEPTASLDPENAKLVAETLRSLRGHCTVVVCTHDASLLGLADEVLLVGGGAARAVGPGELDRGGLLGLLEGRAPGAARG